MRAVALLLILFTSLFLSVQAAPLERDGEHRVASIVDGDTVVLDDGHQVRLVGIQAPKLPLGRVGFAAWPLADEAKSELEHIVLGKRVSLSYGGARVDRHRRLLAHLHLVGSEDWVQGEMLSSGLARVYTFADNRAVVDRMLALERKARAERRGIWADPFYRILTPESAGRHIDTFQLVEGRVLTSAKVKGRTYLNFGADWRTDFTVSIPPDAARLFRDAAMDPGILQGKTVRVRGWLSLRNGPAMEATHPEQIEILD